MILNQILQLYHIKIPNFINFTIFSFSAQDLKDPRRRDDLAAARATLKKNSMMLLTTSKVGTPYSDLFCDLTLTLDIWSHRFTDIDFKL